MSKEVLKHAMQLLHAYTVRCMDGKHLDEKSDKTMPFSNEIPGLLFYAMCNALSDYNRLSGRTLVLLCCLCSNELSNSVGDGTETDVEENREYFGMTLEQHIAHSTRQDKSGLKGALTDLAKENEKLTNAGNQFRKDDTDLISLIRDSLWDTISGELILNGEFTDIGGEIPEWIDVGRYMASPPILAFKHHTSSTRDSGSSMSEGENPLKFVHGMAGIHTGDLSVLLQSSPLRPGIGSAVSSRAFMWGYNLSRNWRGNDKWSKMITKDLKTCRKLRRTLLSESTTRNTGEEWSEGEYLSHCSCSKCAASFMGCSRAGIFKILSVAYSQQQPGESNGEVVVVPLKDIIWRVAVKPRVLRESDERFSMLTPFSEETISGVLPDAGTLLGASGYPRISVVFLNDGWFNLDVCEETIQHISKFAVERAIKTTGECGFCGYTGLIYLQDDRIDQETGEAARFMAVVLSKLTGDGSTYDILVQETGSLVYTEREIDAMIHGKSFGGVFYAPGEI